MRVLLLCLHLWLVADDPDFAQQGEYRGPTRSMQAIALGEDTFRLQLYEGGLPGRGWNQQPPQVIDQADEATLQDLVDSLQLSKIDEASPTLGSTPPDGAIFLFDGTATSLQDHWQDGAKLTENGTLAAGATTRDRFQDYRLHLEFRTPFMPAARGQGRGNSGVYHQGRYETQILDSFGEAGLDNECGGLYSLRAPDVNACLPPRAWQTYDVDFTAARFNEVGSKRSSARITVRLNGIVVHRDVELPTASPGSLLAESAEDGPLHLQDHNDPVEFRNIWIVPIDGDAVTHRPRSIGFERLYDDSDDPSLDQAAAGRILISQLHCTQCHEASESQQAWLASAPPPALANLASRVRPDWLVEYLTSERGALHGNRMPDVWHASPEARREEGVSIASYLLSRGAPPRDSSGTAAAAERGRGLYHTVGCVACHAARDEPSTPESTSAPLGELSQKYTRSSLADFLLAPHAARPSGWMPACGLGPDEARDLATYLLADVVVEEAGPRLRVDVYEGEWSALPDFRSLQPVRTSEVLDLDLSIAQRGHNYALRYETYLHTEPGAYRIFLGSDDGSRLWIDDRMVVEIDGVHGFEWRDQEVSLDDRPHRMVIEYFQAYGEAALRVELTGPGLSRTELAELVSLDPTQDNRWLVEPQIAIPSDRREAGERLFVERGCAQCHREVTDRSSGTRRSVPPLQDLQAERGCLGEQVPAAAPQYRLTAVQLEALRAAVRWLQQNERSPAPADRLHLQMATANCYACHARDGRGGIERARSDWFVSTIPEMGEEGRVPPPLDRVGDKLQAEYLRQLVQQGGKERPYMKTRMPGFGSTISGSIAPSLEAIDLNPSGALDLDFDEPARLQAAGRTLVGDRGLSCIKCHTLRGIGTPGIQAIDMLAMPRRLRPEWFNRYLIDPQQYRPGTRMPASFVDGRSVLTSIYDGDPAAQTAAMWTYLSSGDVIRLPTGLEPQQIELIPRDRPIVYRNFLAGLSPSGIAVGFPESIHGAWDVKTCGWRLLWRGPFIDASMHWVGRGAGSQGPLGDEIIDFERQSPVAILPRVDAPWPSESVTEHGGQFLGYRLDPHGTPTFRYRVPGWEVQDRAVPQLDADGRAFFLRTWQVTRHDSTSLPQDPLVIRLLAGGPIERLSANSYRQGGLQLTLRGAIADQAQLVDTDQGQELRLPISDPPATIETKLHW